MALNAFQREKISREAAQQLAVLYEAAEYELTTRIAQRVLRGIDEPGWYEAKLQDIQRLREELQIYLQSLQKKGKKKLAQVATDAYLAGYQATSDHLTEVEQVSLHYRLTARTNERAVMALARVVGQSAGDQFVQSHQHLLRSTEDTYRAIIGRASALAATGAATRRAATHKALYEFGDRGIVTFKDKAGRTWGMQEYAEMATRTAVIRAYTQGSVDRFKEDGRDLVMVSNSPEECALCRPWEGKVLSVSGKHYDSAVTPGQNRTQPPPTLDDITHADKPSQTLQKRKQKRSDIDSYMALNEDYYHLQQSLIRLYAQAPRDQEALDAALKREKAIERALKKLHATMLPDGFSKKQFDSLPEHTKLDYLSGLIQQVHEDKKKHFDAYHQARTTLDRDSLPFYQALWNYRAITQASDNLHALIKQTQDASRRLRGDVQMPPAKEGTWAAATQAAIRTGATTEQEVRAIGQMIRTELTRRFADVPASEYRAMARTTLGELRFFGDSTSDSFAFGDAFRRGIPHAIENTEHDARSFLDAIRSYLPQSWITRSNERGKLFTSFVSRGYHRFLDGDSEVMLSGWREKRVRKQFGITETHYRYSCERVALHEMLHRMQDMHPHLRELETAFHTRRTTGERLINLQDYHGGAYGADEHSYKDRFHHIYIGKVYGAAKEPREILTMASEYAFFYGHDLKDWEYDPELMDFIYGILVLL